MITPQDQIGGYTPTPWHCEDGQIFNADGMLICTGSTSEDFPRVTETEDQDEIDVRADLDKECAGNLELIVRAVNAHEALMKALEEIAASHLGDCPASMDERDFAHAHVSGLRRIARDAILGASRVGAL